MGQRDVTVAITLAGADVEEPAFGINVGDLQAQAFAQAQAAGIDRGQGDAMIQRGHGREEAPHLGGGEHDGEFELGIGAGQLEFVGPDAFEGFFPEELEGADDLGGSLAGDFLYGLEMDAVLAELLGGNQIGRFGIELTELTEAGKIGLLGAGADGEESEVIGEGIEAGVRGTFFICMGRFGKRTLMCGSRVRLKPARDPRRSVKTRTRKTTNSTRTLPTMRSLRLPSPRRVAASFNT